MAKTAAHSVTAPTRARNTPDSGSTASRTPVNGNSCGNQASHATPDIPARPATTAAAPAAAVPTPETTGRNRRGTSSEATDVATPRPRATTRPAPAGFTARSTRGAQRPDLPAGAGTRGFRRRPG